MFAVLAKAVKCLKCFHRFGMFEGYHVFGMFEVLAKSWSVSGVSKALKCLTS
jgi:hypothetical protein